MLICTIFVIQNKGLPFTKQNYTPCLDTNQKEDSRASSSPSVTERDNSKDADQDFALLEISPHTVLSKEWIETTVAQF